MCVLCDVLCESELVIGHLFVSMQNFQVGGDVRAPGRAGTASNDTLRLGDGLPYQWLFCFPLSCVSPNMLCTYLDSAQNV